jgi:Ca2+-dependent lipid-binding protein
MAQIQVIVIEGRNLKKKDLFTENDAYVQIYLDDKKQKQKTTVKNNCKTPVWNQSFVLYDLLFHH